MDLIKLTGINVSNEEELAEITRQISCFSADSAREYADQLLEHLALHSLAKLPPGYRSIHEIFAKIKEMLNGSFEYDQVLGALRRLNQHSEVEGRNIDDDEEATFRISVDKISNLSHDFNEYKELEKQIFDEWLNDIEFKYPQLSSTELEELHSDLIKFSMVFYSQHSIENVAVYFGDNDNLGVLLEELDRINLEDILPKRSHDLEIIRSLELPRFFRQAPSIRRNFIGKQLNSVFALHMLQLSPRAVEIVSNSISGGVLFLDTNFLYRLVGLNGTPDLQLASKRLLEISSKLGYQAVVSPRTIEEYKSSLEKFQRGARSFPTISAHVAKAALEATSDEDIFTHIWRQRISSKSIDLDSYLSFYNNIEILLSDQYGVPIDDQYDTHIRNNDVDLSTEESLLRNTLPEYSPPSDAVVQHDAHMRLLILLLRQGREGESPLQTPFWFLTCDTKLVKYDRRARPRQKLKIPFCTLSSQWMQLISPFSTSQEKYEVMQAATLESPLFRLFRPPSSKAIQDIITRMTISEGHSPTVTAKILMQGRFVKAFSEEKSDADRTKVFEDYFFGEFASDMEREKQLLETRIEKLEIDNQSLLSQKDDVKEETKLLRKQLEEYKQSIELIEQRETDPTESQVYLEAVKERDELLSRVDQLDSLQIEVNTLKSTSVENQNLKEQLEQQKTLVAQQKQEQEKRQKIVTTLLVWVFAIVLLSITRPWEVNTDLKWLSLSIPLVAFVITLFTFLNHKLLAPLPRGFFYLVNLLAVCITVGLPLGVPISDVVAGLVSLATIISGIFAYLTLSESSN